MKDDIRAENFEKANETKIQIEKIRNLTKPSTKPYEYLKNPNLIEDQIEGSVRELSKVLNLKQLGRIECYDIATLQGTNSTGSMVVFTKGVKDSSSYRRFKIKVEGKPNDYEMISETLIRRFKHSEWPIPDLIIIDGGKGQLGTFTSLGINIPCLALAKKEEVVYYQNKIICLDKSSSALKLLQRIRDEAHRFATNYHKKLRLKSLTIKT